MVFDFRSTAFDPANVCGRDPGDQPYMYVADTAIGAPAASRPQLNPVDGRIFAEVFLGLVFADMLSDLSEDPGWTPGAGADYKLKVFVGYAMEK